MKYITCIIWMCLITGCSQKRDSAGLGDGLGWTSDEVANRIAVNFVLANGHSDWKILSTEKTSDGWIYVFVTSDPNPTSEDPLLTQVNPHIYTNKRSVFVRCDGGMVEMCPVG